eukprot:TRINITY_DN2169_c0_g1_i5.p1 TRINITY_DN2169_c0_g1~~TRINITY_DN2169_c0_g1_i5.p1  ORF type:complete len:176 (+),score=21.16 TRINITY_DN2169_c0_g1_i5:707-1234(+)
MCSTYAAQEKSKLGKAARQAMRCPCTSGWKGQARVADELEITRTDVWLEAHTKKDGSASCEETERVRIIHENNPSFAQGHLDQDPVARVCGRDTCGHVKGMGSGISKYAISRSAPYRRALEREKKSNVTLHTEVEQLKEQMMETQQILASHGGGQMRFSSKARFLTSGDTIRPVK